MHTYIYMYTYIYIILKYSLSYIDICTCEYILSMQAVQLVTRPDTAGYRWCQVASTVTKVGTDTIVSVV